MNSEPQTEVTPTVDHGDGWEKPYRLLVTDATGAVVIERMAEDLKVEVPPWQPCQTRLDIWKWLRQPYGGGGSRYAGWLRLWIHAMDKPEDVLEDQL